jgi:hypothetical protein
MQHEFDAMIDGRMPVGRTHFAFLLGHRLFDKEQMLKGPLEDIDSAFLQVGSWLVADHVGYFGPRDEVADARRYGGRYGQWLVQPRETDERWVGLTSEGVEAHTLQYWLERHFEPYYEPRRVDRPPPSWFFKRCKPLVEKVEMWDGSLGFRPVLDLVVVARAALEWTDGHISVRVVDVPPPQIVVEDPPDPEETLFAF